MKTFYYTNTILNKTGDRVVNIYNIKNNKPIHIGNIKVNIYKSDRVQEIVNYLSENNFIPKSYKGKNYFESVCLKYKIQQIA